MLTLIKPNGDTVQIANGPMYNGEAIENAAEMIFANLAILN